MMDVFATRKNSILFWKNLPKIKYFSEIWWLTGFWKNIIFQLCTFYLFRILINRCKVGDFNTTNFMWALYYFYTAITARSSGCLLCGPTSVWWLATSNCWVRVFLRVAVCLLCEGWLNSHLCIGFLRSKQVPNFYFYYLSVNNTIDFLITRLFDFGRSQLAGLIHTLSLQTHTLTVFYLLSLTILTDLKYTLTYNWRGIPLLLKKKQKKLSLNFQSF